MSRLTTKLLRDLGASKWQFLAVTFVVFLGVVLFVGSYVSYENLKTSYQLSYERLRFADFWVSCDGAPTEVVRRIARQPGVVAALGRIVEEIGIRQPGFVREEIIGRLISLPTREHPSINDVKVIEGRYFSRQARREALLEASFAEYYDYHPGATIRPVIQGEEVPFRVVGIVQSPEYILAIPNKQYLMPMPSIFGVIFVPQEEAERLLDFGGLINEVVVRADPRRRSALMSLAEQWLRPYGAEEAMPQEKQPSHQLLKMDLDGFRQLGLIFPVLFLSAAALTTYSLLMRLVHAQRTQIGFLRASGYAIPAILFHYLEFAVAVGSLGGILGASGGHFLSAWITQRYTGLLNIPFTAILPRWGLMMTGVGLGLGCCLVAGAGPALAAARLAPAVAMRLEPPPAGRKPLLELWFPVLSRLPFTWKLPLRNLIRSRRRTLSTVGGLAAAVSLVIIFATFSDAMDQAFLLSFREIIRYDARAILLPEQASDIAFHVAQWQGVQRVEPGLDVPVEIRKDGVVHSTMLVGLRPDARLWGFLGAEGMRLSPRQDALLMGQELRQKLGVETGDRLLLRYARSTDETRLERTVTVGPPLRQPFGSLVYLPLDQVRQMFASPLDYPPNAVASLMLAIDDRYQDEVEARLYDLDGVVAVESQAAMKEEIEELMAFNDLFVGLMLLFGGGLAFAIIFNTMSINVLERTRELAALRTLGHSHRWVSQMLTIENFLSALLGVLVGLPFGHALGRYLFRMYQNEMISLSPVIYPRTYAVAGVGILLALFASQIPSLRYVRSLDLAKATKEQTG